MKQVESFAHHWLVELTEEEFFGVVFLQSDEVLRICPRGEDRTLRRVAMRTIEHGQPKLSDNWNLAENLTRARENLATGLPLSELLLREVRGNEREYGKWYLQDGSHRALGYATLIVLGEGAYKPQRAYCCMSKDVAL
jgi:hypothetical protein